MAVESGDIKAIVDAIKEGIASAQVSVAEAAATAKTGDAVTRAENLKREAQALQAKLDIEKKVSKSGADRIEQTKKQVDINNKLLASYKELKDAGIELGTMEEEMIENLENENKALEENEKAREKNNALLEKSKAAGDALGQSIGGLVGVYGKGAISLTGFGAGLTKAWKAMDSWQGVGNLLKGSLLGLLDTIIAFTLQVDQAESDLMKTTGASREFSQEIFKNTQELARYGVGVKELSESTQALYTNYTDFTFATKEQAATLAETGAMLSKLGVGADDFAKGLQVSTKAFGMSAGAAASTAIELESLAREIGVTPQQMASDFAGAGNSMAKMGDQGVRAFKDLAIVSKVTGLEINKLMALTDKFDTFEGAATQAGKLNAALGGNFVNAMDLMMATDPAERFGMIRDSILDTGLTFDSMSYYQRKFFADAAGLDSVSDLALALSGDMSTVAGATQKTTAEYKEMAERTKAVQSITEEFKAIMMSLIPAVQPLIDALKEMAKDVDRNRDALKSFVEMLSFFVYILAFVIDHWIIFTLLFLGFKVTALLGGFQMLGTAITGIGTAAAGAVPAGQGLGTMISTVGAAAKTAAPGLLALGATALMIGGGIAVAALGLAQLAMAFGGLGEAAVPAAWAIGIFTVAFMVMMVAIVALVAGPQAALVAGAVGVLLAVGAAALMIGGSMALAAHGVAVLVSAFTNMFTSMANIDFGPMTEFFTSLASNAIGLIGAAAGLGAMAYSMLLLNASIRLFPTSELKDFANFFNSLAALQTAELEGVATAIKKINDQIDKLPQKKALALKTTMDSVIMATAVSRTQASARAGMAATTAAAAGAEKPYLLTINLEMEGKPLTQKIVKVVSGIATETGARGSSTG